MKAVCLILFGYIVSGCSDIPLPTVHEQLRQHILEAEPQSDHLYAIPGYIGETDDIKSLEAGTKKIPLQMKSSLSRYY